jgi:phosphoribosyl-dephospho-CoA transferase
MTSVTFFLLFMGTMAEVSIGQDSTDLKQMMVELEREFRAGEWGWGERSE